MSDEERDRKNLRFIWKLVLFAAYLLVLSYVLFFFEREASEQARYNLKPFAEIWRYLQYARRIGRGRALLNLLGNVLLFLPCGFFLPALFRGKRSHPVAAILACCLFSVVIETCQLMTHLGSCDVDDVILNTLGGAIGYGMYVIYRFVRYGGRDTVGAGVEENGSEKKERKE